MQCLYGFTPFFQENRQKTKERIVVSECWIQQLPVLTFEGT